MVFVLYLIISSNFLAQLFSCRLQEMMNNSMLAKHFVGYMTLLFFVVLSSGDTYSTTSAILYSLYLYLIFWFSTRISSEYLLVFLLLTATLYILQLYEKQNGEQKSRRLEITQEVIRWFMFVVLVVGFIFYWIEKKIEYKNKFSILTFIAGRPVCRNKSPTVTTDKLFKFFKRKKKSVSPKK
jgi:cytochrome c biogenesis factor